MAAIQQLMMSIAATSSSSNDLSTLSNLLILVRPKYDADEGRLWQDTGKTTPANDPDEVVRVASSPAEVASAVDLVETSGTARIKYGVDSDGFGYFEATGADPEDGSLTNTSVLASVGTGAWSCGGWVMLPSGTTAASLIGDAFGTGWTLGVANPKVPAASYGIGQSVDTGSQNFQQDVPQLIQVSFDGISTLSLKYHDDDVRTATVTPLDLVDNFHLFPYYAEAGTRVYSFWFRNHAASLADMDVAYNAGPNGDGIGWPPPLELEAAVVEYSGGLVRIVTLQDYTLGTGSPTVTIDGDPVVCPRVWPISARTLLIRIPTANVIEDDTAAVTVTLPEGLLSIGSVTDAEVVNRTNINFLPTEPDEDASDMPVGINSYQPNYFASAIPFADGLKLLTPSWNAGGGTVTQDANGWPSSMTGTAYVFGFFFADIGTFWPSGSYLLRSQGAGSVALYNHNGNTAYSVASSGTAGGWNYQIVTVTTPGTDDALMLHVVPPITAAELRFPGTWDAGTHLPTTDFHPEWATAYGSLNHFRLMDWTATNNSNVRNASDFLPDGWFTHDGTGRRTATGTITATSTSTSTFLGTGWSGVTVYLITHNAAGDPFQTGDAVLTSWGLTWPVERISATQFKTFGDSGSAPTGTVSLSVDASGIIEDAIRLTNELDQDTWVCVPHLATDAAVTAFAQRILAVLDPGRKVRVELSNECWNFGFLQWQYFAAVGRVAGTSATVEYAKRAADIHQLFLDEFTAEGRASDLIRVVGWQAAGGSSGSTMLDAYTARCVDQSYDFTAPHEYAIAPYYGNDIDPYGSSDPGPTRQRDFLLNGSNDLEPLSATQILDIAGWLLENVTSVWVTDTAAMLATWNTANSAAVELTTYEGSQHMTGAELSMSGHASGDGPNYAGTNGLNGAGLAWDQALRRANRHPRMVNLQYASLIQCLDAGCKLWTQFTSDGTYSRYGYWSVRTYYNQVVGPGDGTGGGNDNRIDLDAEQGSEAVKLYPLVQWQAASPPPTVTIGTWDTSTDPVSRTLVATNVSGDFTMNAAFSTDYSYWSDQVNFSGIIGNTSQLFATHADAYSLNRKFTTVITPPTGETVALAALTLYAMMQGGVENEFSVAVWVNGSQIYTSSSATGTPWGGTGLRAITADLSSAGPFDPDEVVTIDVTLAPVANFAYSMGIGADPGDADSLKLTGSVAST